MGTPLGVPYTPIRSLEHPGHNKTLNNISNYSPLFAFFPLSSIKMLRTFLALFIKKGAAAQDFSTLYSSPIRSTLHFDANCILLCIFYRHIYGLSLLLHGERLAVRRGNT